MPSPPPRSQSGRDGHRPASRIVTLPTVVDVTTCRGPEGCEPGREGLPGRLGIDGPRASHDGPQPFTTAWTCRWWLLSAARHGAVLHEARQRFLIGH